MSDDIREDCKWLNDVECPYAMGHERCFGCSSYEPHIHPSNCGCPDCKADRGCAQFHMKQDMGEI